MVRYLFCRRLRRASRPKGRIRFAALALTAPVALLVLALLPASPALAQQWARKMFETTSHDFGMVARHAKAEYRFVLTNRYLEDVHVLSARPSCGCISTKIDKPLLKTYEQGAIVAILNTKAYRGHRKVTVTVTLDRPFYAQVQLHVKAYIRSDVVLQPGEVELGNVDRETPVEKTISVTRYGRSDWQIRKVQSANPHLSAEVGDRTQRWNEVSYQLRVRLHPDAPVGKIHEHLMLVTNDSRSEGIPVPVHGQVLPDVTVSPGSLFMGVVAPGAKVTKQVVLRGKRPFRIVAVAAEGGGFQLQCPVSEDPKPLHVIPITFIAGDQPGKVVQTIRFETDLDEAPPEVSTFAVVEQ